MKFGELLRASQIEAWSPHYIDYAGLKEFIKSHTPNADPAAGRFPDPFDHIEFKHRFASEHDRVVRFVAGKLAELVDRIEFLANHFSAPRADQVARDILNFESFVCDSHVAEVKILKKYAKYTGYKAVWHDLVDNRLSAARSTIHPLIVQLSAMHERQNASNGTSWVPPDTFVRKTVKYWVRPEHITAVKLLVVRHLPILEVNASTPPSRELSAVPASQIHNYLSSVYFDSDDAACFHRRIAQEEGATLLRIRWYGGVRGVDGLPKPPGPETVFFVELKTHHDALLSGLKSTKERFPLTGAMVGGFLDGTLGADSCIDSMAAMGHIRPDKVLAQKELAAFIQNLVLSQKLRPMIRTVYHRTAFQLADSNEVRISFDYPMHLLQENGSGCAGVADQSEVRSRSGGKKGGGDRWMARFGTNDFAPSRFGFGILEVKTSEEPPEWVSELLATGWLVRVEKFSKFQHAMAMFHPQRCRVQPYWMNNESNPAAAADGSAAGTAASAALPSAASATAGSQAAAVADEDRIAAANIRERQLMIHDFSAAIGDQPLLPLSIASTPANEMRSRASNATPPRSTRKVEFGSERDGPFVDVLTGNGASINAADPYSDLQTPLIAGSVEGRSPLSAQRSSLGNLLRRRLFLRNAAAASAAPPPPRPPPARAPTTNLTRMKVEPKVFFANERTFLHWLFAGVLLITIGMGIMSISPRTQIYGLTLLSIALVFILYAMGLYRWRLLRILRRDGTRFDDRIGPWIISACLIAAVGIVFYNEWVGRDTTVFKCEMRPPPSAPLDLLENLSAVRFHDFGQLRFGTLSDALWRAAVCTATSRAFGRASPPPSASPDLESPAASAALKAGEKAEVAIQPIVSWDATVTFICFNASDDCQTPSGSRGAYASYDAALRRFRLSIDINGPLMAIVDENAASLRPGTSIVGNPNLPNVYAEVFRDNVTALPATVEAINTLLKVALLDPTSTVVTTQTLLRTKYVYDEVHYGGAVGAIVINADFATADDRAMQSRPLRVTVAVEVGPNESGGAADGKSAVAAPTQFTYSVVRRAQSMIFALFENVDVLDNGVPNHWHS